MDRKDKSTWALIAVAIFCAACALLAFNGLELQALDETMGLGSKVATSLERPAVYRADSRADIMLQAAGPILN
ncbi:MAG: hypothetical protein HY926_03945 [Elusimicrobia bacterium]|nr:hypothetical protein [Elusimicrobiota bacterium]